MIAGSTSPCISLIAVTFFSNSYRCYASFLCTVIIRIIEKNISITIFSIVTICQNDKKAIISFYTFCHSRKIWTYHLPLQLSNWNTQTNKANHITKKTFFWRKATTAIQQVLRISTIVSKINWTNNYLSAWNCNSAQ